MQTQFTVLFDACVLYPAPVRDILLELASKGLFRGRWTKKIQEEWVRNLQKNRPDLNENQLARTCKFMNNSVLNCLVEDFEELESGISLPDPGDIHILAAAIKSQAQIIVTYNMKDFPVEIIKKFDIEAQHPDTFFRYQMELHLPAFLSCIKTIRSRLINPPRTANEYLFTLFPLIPQTVSILKQYENVI
jgi:predicted nucleic acid-binding protein